MYRLTFAAILLAGVVLPVAAAPQPVTNPELVSAISGFLLDRSRGARYRMFAELNRARYLVPLQRSSSLDKTYASFDLPKVGKCIPALTDHDEVIAAGLLGQQLDEVAAADLWNLLEHNGLDCILVNPGTQPLPLRRKLIEQIRRF